MTWQRKASMAVAVVGLGLAVGVSSIGTRQARVSPQVPARIDPKAVLESSGATAQQVRGTKEDYEIKAQRQLTYTGGATTSFDVEISVRDTGGRDFVMTAKEARSGEKNSVVDISGAVTLKASDGFVMTTERATFNDAEGIVRAEGALVFHRGGMSGTGVGMTYDKNKDVLQILDQAAVTFVDESGATTMQFTGGGATLTRPAHVLVVERNAHAIRGDQNLEAVTATARLTDTDEQITYIELRGNSRVAGGSSAFDSMSANDIDLDYTDDGAALERVVLTGGGAVALTGTEGAAGRQFFGDSLTMLLNAENDVTSVVGRGNVRLDLPATATASRRSIRAKSLEAAGAGGRGLEKATFTDSVEYQENPAKAGGQPRVVKAQALSAALAADEITSAVFTGGVTFVEQGLEAAGSRADYDPDAGTLRLTGAHQGRAPHVADEDVSVDADGISVTLKGHHILAKGAVKTILQPQREGSNSKLPSLLNGKQTANANAGTLEYDGEKGVASYTGNVQLWQGDTAIFADRISIDRSSGDLVAVSMAPLGSRSTMTMDGDVTVGRSQEIRYTDTKREIAYTGAPVKPAPSKAGAPTVTVAPVAPAQVSGPQGDLRGERIVILLKRDENDIDRLDAYTSITLKLDTRNASGARLTYHAADERYVMSGAATVPVKVTERCRDTVGNTLTFFKSTDRIIVDGNEQIRTQTKSGGGPCREPAVPKR